MRTTTLFLLAIVLGSAFAVRAEDYSSSQYRIESGNVSYEDTSPVYEGNYNLSTELGRSIRTKFDTDGYAVYAFGTQRAASSFTRASLNTTNLLFRDIDTKNESDDHVKLTVRANEGDSVATVFQVGQFQNAFSQAIPPTLCDERSPCSPTTQNVWEKTFGIGYSTGNAKFSPFFIPAGGAPEISRILPFEQREAQWLYDLQVRVRPNDNTPEGAYKGTIIVTASSSL